MQLSFVPFSHLYDPQVCSMQEFMFSENIISVLTLQLHALLQNIKKQFSGRTVNRFPYT